jgi:hypothetical protein
MNKDNNSLKDKILVSRERIIEIPKNNNDQKRRYITFGIILFVILFILLK